MVNGFIILGIVIAVTVVSVLLYLFFKGDTYVEVSKKPNFQEAIIQTKKALDSIGVPFHVHSGTALGFIREGDFLLHDHDIDIAVFKDDYRSDIINAMTKHGFLYEDSLGNIENGLEYKFYYPGKTLSDGVRLDIFFLYPDNGKYRQSIYHCTSKKLKKGKTPNECLLYTSMYKPKQINIFGVTLHTAPEQFLVDRYGKDWRIPKKFGYFDGLESGSYHTVV